MNKHDLVGGNSTICLCSPRKLGRWTHFDSYFSKGLKPPTRYASSILTVSSITVVYIQDLEFVSPVNKPNHHKTHWLPWLCFKKPLTEGRQSRASRRGSRIQTFGPKFEDVGWNGSGQKKKWPPTTSPWPSPQGAVAFWKGNHLISKKSRLVKYFKFDQMVDVDQFGWMATCTKTNSRFIPKIRQSLPPQEKRKISQQTFFSHLSGNVLQMLEAAMLNDQIFRY